MQFLELQRISFGAERHGRLRMDGLKLFVVGERSPDPKDWDNVTYARAIVIARNKEEALAMHDGAGRDGL
jgi:hypothetical protein